MKFVIIEKSQPGCNAIETPLFYIDSFEEMLTVLRNLRQLVKEVHDLFVIETKVVR